VTATFWLLEAPDSLRAQSHREPDGTGLGYFDSDGRPVVEKQPLAAYEDQAFAREARTTHSTAFVSHVRFASTGALELRNTHPFEQEGRLFAHNGVVEDLAALEGQLGPERTLVTGDTDSERFFALITKQIAARDGDIAGGVTAAVDWVADHVPVLSLNFILIAPGELWALRYPDTHEFHVLERPAGTPLDHTSSHGTHVHSEHAASRPTVVLASEKMDDDPGWRMLQSGELLHVTERLETHSQIIRERPPARLLTLADLEGRARSSQSSS
jgi:predicted glutamine amidotransferase